jgi:hypothetical protein
MCVVYARSSGIVRLRWSRPIAYLGAVLELWEESDHELLRGNVAATVSLTNRTRSLNKLAPRKTPLDRLVGWITDSRLTSELRAALEEQGVQF